MAPLDIVDKLSDQYLQSDFALVLASTDRTSTQSALAQQDDFFSVVAGFPGLSKIHSFVDIQPQAFGRRTTAH